MTRFKSLYFFFLINILALLFLLSACNSNKDFLFTQLPASKSGIHFKNTITETENDSTLISEFAYMGGGVGIGDFNNDGLKDVFFTANQQSSALYINKGALTFEDITQKAGVGTNVWATGVSIIDINNDGFDDIYLCTYGKNLLQRTKNLLFINQHNLTFKEEAEAYGLADTSYSTQAAFFDYDKDGDLDMYLLNYRLNGPNANVITPKDLTGKSPANDKLFRNEGSNNGSGHPIFTDVSLEAGIKEDGYGLGISVSDYNGDNWPDVYISCDFLSNDVLWLNNQNGTFSNVTAQSVNHTSYSGMGSDAADINNDGLPDVATVDMMPEDNRRKKLMFSFMNYERYETERSLNYEPEFVRNMLQINNGVQISNDTALPFFSETGQMAGISETDWSWSILLADFNNDGWKDVHITNGIGRDYINADFIQYSASIQNFYSEEEKRKTLNEELKALKHAELSNYLYLNNKDYTFTDYSKEGGINEPSLSSGAAYADLDNDGDLDLVVNNINKEPYLFINNTVKDAKTQKGHFLSVQLKGDRLNSYGIGSKLLAYYGGKTHLQEQHPIRGYLSSVDRTLVFGLGESTTIDSLVVIWPNNRKQTLSAIKADTFITLHQENAQQIFEPQYANSPTLFTALTDDHQLSYKHEEVVINDYALQRLLPQKFSQLGPYMAVGDVNKDGLDDIFAGGGFNSNGKLLIQNDDGHFTSANIPKDAFQEDAACAFFDANGDGLEDLLITYGDFRYEDTSQLYHPKLFMNDGKGGFTVNEKAIPNSVRTIGGAIAIADYDGDGDSDIFIGGRVSKKYPTIPQSYLLQNNEGTFTDITQKANSNLKNVGMVTAALWTDIDKDGQPDLVVAGEWMAIRFFKNNKGALTEVTENTGLSANKGMWRSLIAVDIDKDGDMDLVAGNFGLNTKYNISPKAPMKLYAKDIDGNGSLDPVPFYYIKDDEGERKLFPAINRDPLADQVPAVKKQFLNHYDYAKATFSDIFKNTDGLMEFTCEEMASCFFENKGNGKFEKHLLPAEAQFAPVNAILCDDFDEDGTLDLLLAGNEYEMEIMTGRYDASYGLFLKGSGKGFSPIPPVNSGFTVKGNVRSMALVKTKSKKLIVVGINNDYLKTFVVNRRRE